MSQFYSDLRSMAEALLDEFGGVDATLVRTTYLPASGSDPGGQQTSAHTTAAVTVLSVQLDRMPASGNDADAMLDAPVEQLMLVCDPSVDVQRFDRITYASNDMALLNPRRYGPPGNAVIWIAEARP